MYSGLNASQYSVVTGCIDFNRGLADFSGRERRDLGIETS